MMLLFACRELTPSSQAQIVEAGADDGGSESATSACRIPAGADTWDGGYDDAGPKDPTGCRPLEAGVQIIVDGRLTNHCSPREYGLQCRTDDTTSMPISGCHPPAAPPIPGPDFYWCCPCDA